MATTITVLGGVGQRRDITENWEYVNPVLPDGQLGWEYASDGTPVGVKMGNGVNAWDDLLYWFETATASRIPIKVPFSASSGFTVTWPTQILTGQTKSCFELYGNLVPPIVVYFGSQSTGYVQNGNSPTVNEDVYGIVNSLVFDFGFAQSGYVRFN